MPILARFTNFCDFYDIRKAVATSLLGIPKTSTVNFGEPLFFLLFVQNFCFPVTQLCALGS